MSSKRSDTPTAPSSSAAVGGRLAASRERGLNPRSPLVGFLKANLPVPILLLLLIPIGWCVEGSGFGPYNQRIVMLVGINIILAVSLQLINGFSGQFSLGHSGFMAVGAYLSAYPAMTYSHRLSDPAACLLFFISLAAVFAIAGLALLGIFLFLRWTRAVHPALPMSLLILLIAWVMADFAKGTSYAQPAPGLFIWTRGVSLLQRLFAWMIESGQGPVGQLSAMLPRSAAEGLCYLVLVLGAGACAGVVGLVVGMPALRLRGDYLAIATLGFAEIIRIVIQNSQPLGGALGLTGIPKYTAFSWLYGAVAITILVVWRLAYSAKGRAIMAVREDEIAAAAVGINPTRQKVVAFIVGAFFGGVAGAMFSLHERSITPGYFGMAKSIEVVVMVTLGGLGSISGAVLAAIVLTVLPELLRDPQSLGIYGWIVVCAVCAATAAIFALRQRQWLKPVAWIVMIAAGWEIAGRLSRHFHISLPEQRMPIYSLTLILMMLFRPQGLLGGVELWPRRRPAPFREAAGSEDREDLNRELELELKHKDPA